MTDATLIAGSRGSQYVNRDELGNYPAPEPTATWKPVAHSTLVDTLHDVMSYRGMFIEKEQYVVDRGGSRLFLTFDLSWMKMEEYGAAFACRHAVDKSLSIQCAIGARVFVCSNMSFLGEMINVRKHTSKLNLAEEMDKAMFRYQQGFQKLRDDIHVQKSTPVGQRYGENLLYDIFRARIVPVRFFHAIADDWAHCEQLNGWGLQNCVTAHIKEMPPAPAFKATARLAKFFAAKF